jgi:rSAM/selenodomain-associated transferase 1
VSIELIIVFTRYPEAGRTKTRLIPELGPQGAADLQRRMTEHVLGRLRVGFDVTETIIEIRYDGGDPDKMQNWLGDNLRYESQGEGNLGNRLERAFGEAFDRGVDRAIAIGTDCPALSLDHIRKGFESLSAQPVVFGPTFDGGYYLVGISRGCRVQSLAALFSQIDWGSEVVLQQSVARLSTWDVDYALLESLADVDRPEDLEVWRRIISCQ